MTTAGVYNTILKNRLGKYAAWLPITNVFEVGDYGLMSDGIFCRMGNISPDYGVPIDVQKGPESKLVFTSAGVRTVHGDATATVPPSAGISGRLVVEFTDEQEFFIRANLTSLEMASIASVADRLARDPLWERRYRVVSAVLAGTDCTIISSVGKGARVELAGDAHALTAFQLDGTAAGSLSASTAERIGLNLIGQTGVMCLSLFKLGIFGGTALLSDDPASISEHTEWNDEADQTDL